MNRRKPPINVLAVELPPFEESAAWLRDALHRCIDTFIGPIIGNSFRWPDVRRLKSCLPDEVCSRLKRALIEGGNWHALYKYLSCVEEDVEVRAAYNKQMDEEYWDEEDLDDGDWDD